jgi:hypothetical protein
MPFPGEALLLKIPLCRQIAPRVLRPWPLTLRLLLGQNGKILPYETMGSAISQSLSDQS